MKKIIATFLITFSALLSAQQIQLEDAKGNVITNTVEFGSILAGDKAEQVVTIKNVGTAPLVISKAQPSCGCTIPTTPTEPIMPGKTAELPIRYTSVNSVGPFSKSVTILSNAKDKERLVFRIKGEVVEKK